jgi:alpha-tubulin suppressor-like RCC1 family protein
MWAWGNNSDGRLGDGTVVNKSSPVQIGGLTNWYQVSGGGSHTAAIKTDGTMWTWGRNITFGQLGDGTVVSRSSPVQIGALTNWSQVSAGFTHTASVKTDGTLWAWGANSQGQLGIGTIVYKSSPIQVGALTSWLQISAGGFHTVALYGVV